MRRLRRADSLVLATTAAAIGAALWWWLAAPPPPAAVPATPAQSEPQQVEGPPFINIEGSRLSGADESGRRLWELEAASLVVSPDRDRVVLAGVTARLYGEDRLLLELRAPSAYHVGTQMMVQLTGGVAGATSDGRMLRAASVAWNGVTRRLTAEDVTLTQGGMTVIADRLAADVGLSEVELEGHVRIGIIP